MRACASVGNFKRPCLSVCENILRMKMSGFKFFWCVYLCLLLLSMTVLTVSLEERLRFAFCKVYSEHNR